MSMMNWRRTYTLKAGVRNQTGFLVGNVESADQIALKIDFEIEKADVKSPNTGKITIWNLSDDNLKILEQEKCIVELKAGYDMTMPLALVGAVASVTTSPDNADRQTELQVADGLISVRDIYITVSLNGVVKSQDLYALIASEMRLPIVFSEELAYVDLPNGFSFVGKAKDALQKVATYNGHIWSIQNQIIQVTYSGRPLSPIGYVLNSSTGLINVPKRVTIETQSSKQTGWEVEFLLNPAIGVNDVVRIESKAVNGLFRVQKITHKGDNYEGDWISTAQVFEIKAPPVSASKSSTAPGNVQT